MQAPPTRFITQGSNYSDPHIVHHRGGGGDDQQFSMYPTDRPPRSRSSSFAASDGDTPNRGQLPPLSRQKLHSLYDDKRSRSASSAGAGAGVVEEPSTNSNTPMRGGGGSNIYTGGTTQAPVNNINNNTTASYFNSQTQQYEYNRYGGVGGGGIPYYAQNLTKNHYHRERAIGGGGEGRPHSFSSHSFFGGEDDASPSSFNKLRNSTRRIIENKKGETKGGMMSRPRRDELSYDHDRMEDRHQQLQQHHKNNGGTMITKSSTQSGTFTTKDGYVVAIPIPPRHRARSRSDSQAAASTSSTTFIGEPTSEQRQRTSSQPTEAKRAAGNAIEREGDVGDDDEPVLVTTKTKTTVDPTDLSIVTTNETRIKIPSQAVTNFLMLSNGGGGLARGQQNTNNNNNTHNILLSSPASPMITAGPRAKPKNIDPEPDEPASSKFIASFGQPSSVVPAEVARKFSSASAYFPSTLKKTDSIPQAEEEQSRFNVLHQRRVALRPYQNARHGRAHAQRESIEASRTKKLQDVDNARKAKVARAIELRGEKAQMKKERDELSNFYVAFGQPTRVYPSRVAASFPRTCHSKYEQYFTKTWDADIEDITFFECPQGEEPREEVRRFEPVYFRRADIQPVEAERHEAAQRKRGHFLRDRQEGILERESKHIKSVKDRGGLAALREQARQIAAATEEESENGKGEDKDDNECLSPRSRALFDIHNASAANNNNGALIKSTTSTTHSASTSTHTKTTSTTVMYGNNSKNNDENNNIPSGPTDMEQQQREEKDEEDTTDPLGKPHASVTEIKKTESFSSSTTSTSTTTTMTTTKNGGEEDTAENSSSRDIMVMSPPPAPRSTSAIIEDEEDEDDYYYYQNKAAAEDGDENQTATAPPAEVEEQQQQYPSVWTLHGIPASKNAGKNDENYNDKGDGLRDTVNPHVNARGFPHTAKRYFSAAPLDVYNNTNKSMPLADEEKMRFTPQDQRREQLARSSEAQDRARDVSKRREVMLSEHRSMLKRQDLMRKIKAQQAIERKERSKIVDDEQNERKPVKGNFKADAVEMNSRPVVSAPNERSEGNENESLSPISRGLRQQQQQQQQPYPNTNSQLFLPNPQIQSSHAADDGHGLMRSVSSMSTSATTTTTTTTSTTREEELGGPTNPTAGATNRNEVGGVTDTMNNNEKRTDLGAPPQALSASDSLTPASSHSSYYKKEENKSSTTTTQTTTLPTATTQPQASLAANVLHETATRTPPRTATTVIPQTTPSASKMPPPPPSPPKSRVERMKAKNAAATAPPPSSASSTLPTAAATTAAPREEAHVFSVPLIANGRSEGGDIVHQQMSSMTTCTTVTSTTTTTQINKVKPVSKPAASSVSRNSRQQQKQQQRPPTYEDDDDENDYYNPKEIFGEEEVVGRNNFPLRQYRQLVLRAPTSRPPPHTFISCFSIPKMVTPSKNASHFPNSRAKFNGTCRNPTSIDGGSTSGAAANRRGGLDTYYNNKNDPMPLAEEEKIRFVPVRIRRMRMPEFDYSLTHDHDEADARRKKFMDTRVQKLKDKRARHQAYLYSDEHLRQMGITVAASPAHLFLMNANNKSIGATKVNRRQHNSDDEVQQRSYPDYHTVWAFGQPKSVIPAANSRDFPRNRRYFIINAQQKKQKKEDNYEPTNNNNNNNLLSAYNKIEEIIPIEAEEMIRFIPLAARRERIAGPADAERADRNAKRKERFLKSRRTSLNNKDRDRKMRVAEAKRNPNRPSAGPMDMAQEYPPPTAAATTIAGNKKRSSQNASFSSAPQSSASSFKAATAGAGASSSKAGGRRGRRLSFAEKDDNDCLSPVSPYPAARGFAAESSTASEVNIPQQANKMSSLSETGGMGGSTTTTTFSHVVHKTESTTTTTTTTRNLACPHHP